jgi:hypothetical protein
MTQIQHQNRGRPTIPEQSPRIGVPPTAAEMLQHADCINGAGLDDHAGRFGTSEILDTGTFTWSYTRTAQARYLCVRAIIAATAPVTTPGTDTVTLDLTLSDGTNTLASSSLKLPRGWKGETHVSPLAYLGGRHDGLHVTGYVDLDDVDDDLSASSDWSITVVVTIAGGAQVQVLSAWEVPGFAIDDDVPGRGVLVGNYSRDREIVDTPLGCEELITQDDYAVTEQRTILSMAWRQQVADSTETPSCASTSYGAVSLLDEGGAVGHFRTIARALPTPGADVPIRFRVLYRMSGGTTETGQVRINTGATGGPWATASLAYTASWTWSAWVTAAHLSGADETTIEAKVSASPAVLWIAAIAVMEACAP